MPIDVFSSAPLRLLAPYIFPPLIEISPTDLPDGSPVDFISSAQLNVMPVNPFLADDLTLPDTAHSDACVIYSVGPDKTDDSAAFEYDPTNGTTSGGDIIIRVPREREFPFPRGGVRAQTAFELLAQFPNGLPADPFASVKGRPLSSIDAAGAAPLTIFSFGPDRDEGWKGPGTGQIYEQFKDKAYPILAPMPALPENATAGRRLQSVFLPHENFLQEGQQPDQGYWNLEAQYDPTNGTTSEGDLFLELKN